MSNIESPKVNPDNFEVIETLDDTNGSTAEVEKWSNTKGDVFYVKKGVPESQMEANLAINPVVEHSSIEAPKAYSADETGVLVTESFGEKPAIPENEASVQYLDQESLVEAYITKALVGDRDISKNIGLDKEEGRFIPFDFDNAGNDLEETHVRARRRLESMVCYLEDKFEFQYDGTPTEDFYSTLGRIGAETDYEEVEAQLEAEDNRLASTLSENFRKAEEGYLSDQGVGSYLEPLNWMVNEVEEEGVEIL